MPTEPNQLVQPLDDAQLRFKSLLEYVGLVQKNWVSDFPGASSLNSLVSHYSGMAQTLFARFESALEKVRDAGEKLAAKNRMVDKLNQEWEVVYQLISSAKLLGNTLETRNDFSWFDLLVSTAQRDLNLSNWDFVVVPRLSQRFALTRFKYASEFAALEMPFSAFNAAWEWGVLWHELAGRKIKELKETVRSPFVIRSITLREEARDRSAGELRAAMEEKLKSNRAIQTEVKLLGRALKEPPAPDWSRDWVEELFEDTCSVLTFGEAFLPVLETILRRLAPSNDNRHPPLQVRMRIARRLLSQNAHAETEEAEKIESDVIKRLLKLIDESGMKLPLRIGDNGTAVHQEIRDVMKKYSAGEATPADTQAIKERLTNTFFKDMDYKRYRSKEPSETVDAWEEVQSGNYKKMLALVLSEGDAFSATSHTYQDHKDYGTRIPLTDLYSLTVFYTDGNGVNHSHDHIY